MFGSCPANRLKNYTLTAIIAFIAHNSFSQPNDISLAESYPAEQLEEILISQPNWHPFPTIFEREAWEQIPEALQKEIMEHAEKYAEMEIPILPASLYLQFKRIGNRSNYQNIWYDRREWLHDLVVAECMENKGRFLDPIADLIWAICEETSWTWPAHIGPQKAGTGLPNPDDQVVALFSAQTSNTLVLTSYLLGDKLDSVSPLIRSRIEREVDRRILTPFLTKEFGWMGYRDRARNDHPNNWNPWVCSNVLVSALLSEKNEERRAKLVHKALECLDNFLTYYPSDGSCDEGPSYWGRAGASLFDCLEYLYGVTDGKIDYYDHSLIQEIGRFIYRAHIVDDYYVCVGDCDAQINISNELIYRYGKRIDDQNMQDLGAYDVDEQDLVKKVQRSTDLNRLLCLLFNGKELIEANPSTPPLVRDVWLSNPNMQLMAARDKEGSTKGLYVAAWGGHNAQSHNHNDVGNFIIFADGKPVVIDVGRPTYTRQTFSSRRYEIWAFQSEFHNLPTINGIEQENGRRFAAKDVSYDMDDSHAQLQMDITDAYPQKAGIESWNRMVRLNREQDVQIVDTYHLRQPSRDITENLIIAGNVEEQKPGQLILNDPEQTVKLLMEYDPEKVSAIVYTLDLEDGKLRSVWGDNIYRIRLNAKSEKKEDEWKIRFSIIP